MNKIFIAAGFLVAATAPSWAQDYYPPDTYGYNYGPGYGVYDYAPGYAYQSGLAPYGYSGGDPYNYDRVSGPGRGNSVESQR